MSQSRVVVQNFTENGSPIVAGQIGEVLQFWLCLMNYYCQKEVLVFKLTHTRTAPSRSKTVENLIINRRIALG